MGLVYVDCEEHLSDRIVKARRGFDKAVLAKADPIWSEVVDSGKIWISARGSTSPDKKLKRLRWLGSTETPDDFRELVREHFNKDAENYMDVRQLIIDVESAVFRVSVSSIDWDPEVHFKAIKAALGKVGPVDITLLNEATRPERMFTNLNRHETSFLAVGNPAVVVTIQALMKNLIADIAKRSEVKSVSSELDFIGEVESVESMGKTSPH